MGHVLIVGCGYVGTALGLRLATRGHVVWALRRNPAGLPMTLHGVEADLLVPNTLRHLPRVDAVVYLIGPVREDDAARADAWVHGLRYLLSALEPQRGSIRRLLFASSVEVYGDREGAWVDEDSAVSGTSALARHRLEGERLAQKGAIPTTVVRLGRVFGPGRPGLLDQVTAGEACDAPCWLNLIHRDDAVGALHHLLDLRSAPGEVVVTDGAPVLEHEAAAWMRTRLGKPPRSADPEPGVARGVRCLNDRLLASGHAFAYPSYREGYAALLSRMR